MLPWPVCLCPKRENGMSGSAMWSWNCQTLPITATQLLFHLTLPVLKCLAKIWQTRCLLEVEKVWKISAEGVVHSHRKCNRDVQVGCTSEQPWEGFLWAASVSQIQEVAAPHQCLPALCQWATFMCIAWKRKQKIRCWPESLLPGKLGFWKTFIFTKVWTHLLTTRKWRWHDGVRAYHGVEALKLCLGGKRIRLY